MGVLCAICGKSFSKQFNLNKHERTVHNVKNKVSFDQSKWSFKCLEKNCKTSFQHNLDLRKHLFTDHNVEMETEVLEFENLEDYNMTLYKTPVSVLQEITVKNQLPPPIYEFSGSGPSHAMEFACFVKAGEKQANGVGKTKKDAKHDAAINLLQLFGISIDKSAQSSGLTPSICVLPSTSKTPAVLINYVGKLNEFCSGHKFPQASYIDTPLLRNSQFSVICRFADHETEGLGRTKKDAKQDAAKNMMALIHDKDIAHSAKLEIAQLCSKIELLDFDKVLSKYEEIKREPRLEILRNNNNNVVGDDVPDVVPHNIDIKSWDELIDIFQQKGFSHELTVYQPRPLILSLKINDSYTLMQTGRTREEILEKLVKNVVMMMNYDCDFKTVLKKM